MEKSYGHKVDKYALIHSAASEIQAHLETFYVRPKDEWDFHMLQIEKSAMFIQFVEDVYITPDSEKITHGDIKRLWDFAQNPANVYECPEFSFLWVSVERLVHKYQKRINGKFLTTTAPF
jgi:hypothetical protein